MARVDPQRAAVGRQLLDVEQREAVRGEDPLGGDEREVREVLVIDGVELVLVHQPHQVRELDGDHAARLEQGLDARHEVVELGHLGEHVVADDQVGLPAGGGQLAAPPSRRRARRGSARPCSPPPRRRWRRARRRARGSPRATKYWRR